MKKIQTALCAYGMSGKVFHAPLLNAHTGYELSHVLIRNPQISVNQYPNLKIVREYDSILSDPTVELVIVNTPEPTHFELTWKALEAKKHVVVEKAFTPSVEEGEKLIHFARKQNCLLTVYQNRRWDSDFLTVQEILRQNLLGKLISFEAHYDRFRDFIQKDTWKEEKIPGTGVLYNLGSHLIDQALLLFGMPQSIFADLQIQREGGNIIDNFDLIMRYEALKVMLRVSYLVPKPGPKYILHGDRGSFFKSGLDPQEEALKKGAEPFGPGWGQEGEDSWGKLYWKKEQLQMDARVPSLPGNYGTFYTQLYKAIREGGKVPVAPEQALQSIQVIEAAIESHSQSRVVFF